MRPRKPNTEDTEKDRNFVTALSRGLELLRCFRKGDQGLGNGEFAKRTGLSKSTISRLTYTLHKDGYLTYDPESALYRLAPPVLSLGFSCLSGIGIRDLAKPMMQELADHSQVPVALAGPDRGTMIYLERCRSSNAITLAIEVGEHIRMATSALGRAHIAGLPEDARNSVLAKLKMQENDDWPMIEKGVDEAISCYRQNGYVLSIGDWKPDVNAVAVPFYSAEANQVLAINCGGPAMLVPEDKLRQDIAPRLVDLVNQLAKITQ